MLPEVPTPVSKPEVVAEVIDVASELENVSTLGDFSMHPVMGLLCLIAGIIIGYHLHTVKFNAPKLEELSGRPQMYLPAFFGIIANIDFKAIFLGVAGGFVVYKSAKWLMTPTPVAPPYTFNEIEAIATRMFPNPRVHTWEAVHARFTRTIPFEVDVNAAEER